MREFIAVSYSDGLHNLPSSIPFLFDTRTYLPARSKRGAIVERNNCLGWATEREAGCAVVRWASRGVSSAGDKFRLPFQFSRAAT